MARSHFYGIIACLAATIAIAMPATASDFYDLDRTISTPTASSIDYDVITIAYKVQNDDVAVLPAIPKCRKCGSKFVDAHAGMFIRSNQPGAAWRVAADIAPPPQARSLN